MAQLNVFDAQKAIMSEMPGDYLHVIVTESFWFFAHWQGSLVFTKLKLKTQLHFGWLLILLDWR